MTEFGHLLETFAVTELIKQASWLDGMAGHGHWRTHFGDEVDLVLERDDGALVAFEVKSSSRASKEDFNGLAKLRGQVDRHFVAGVVLYLGARSYNHDDRLYVMPLDRLWTARPC